MSVLSSRPALRWAVPGAVLALALGAGTLGRVLIADAAPALPPRTAAELLVDLQKARVAGLSGTVVQKADLGLPNLSFGPGNQGSSEFTSLVSGVHTLRVWYAGEDKQRVALLGTLGESDAIHNGRDVWLWNSNRNEATHIRLPADATATKKPRPLASGLPKTPEEAAAAALAAISPTTAVSTDGTAQVAGRPAYELVLRPKDTASRVGQVRLAVDAEKKVPLRVQIFARNTGTPAFEVGFTRISFAVPTDQHFRFTPPPGAKVTESTRESDRKRGPKKPDPAAENRPTVVGQGWTAVVVGKAADLTGRPATGDRDRYRNRGNALASALASLPRLSGAWGSGRLLQSKLLSVLITDDGRILAGAVDPSRLYEVAAK